MSGSRMIWRGLMVVAVAVILTLVTVSTATGQYLEGRSRIELGLGLAVRSGSSTSTSAGGVISETDAAGMLGCIGYSYWFRENLAGTIMIGAMGADVESRTGSSGVSSRTAVVAPIFVGVRFYLPESTFSTQWRPYLAAAAGPVIGTESESRVGNTITFEAISRTALGGRLGAGLDIVLSHRFVLGVFGGYDVMTDFSDPIGARENHSGPDFGLSFSVLFGGR